MIHLKKFSYLNVNIPLATRFNYYFSSTTFKNIQKTEEEFEYDIIQAMKLVRAHAIAPFDETISTCIRLNVDPKHGDQVVRGSVSMPYGIGKKHTIAVFAPVSMKSIVLEAGADIFGEKETLQDIKNGIINFDKLIATPDVISDLKPFSKILGPKGLMPNLKVGTLITMDKLEQAVKDAKKGSVTYRVDPGRNIHSPLGKISFKNEMIFGNLKALIKSLAEKKPASLKGAYFNTAYVTSTHGPSWKVKVETMDSRSKECMIQKKGKNNKIRLLWFS